MVLAVSVGAILMATALFSTWTRAYDSYWFLTATTAVVLTFGMAIAAIPHRIAMHVVAAACLVAVASQQQTRVAQARAFFSYPPYRVMRIAIHQAGGPGAGAARHSGQLRGRASDDGQVHHL